LGKIKVTIKITKKVEPSRYDKEKEWSQKYRLECEIGETFTHFKKRIREEERIMIKIQMDIKRKELENQVSFKS